MKLEQNKNYRFLDCLQMWSIAVIIAIVASYLTPYFSLNPFKTLINTISLLLSILA